MVDTCICILLILVMVLVIMYRGYHGDVLFSEFDDTDRDDDGNKIIDDPSVPGSRRRRETMKKVIK